MQFSFCANVNDTSQMTLYSEKDVTSELIWLISGIIGCVQLFLNITVKLHKKIRLHATQNMQPIKAALTFPIALPIHNCCVTDCMYTVHSFSQMASIIKGTRSTPRPLNINNVTEPSLLTFGVQVTSVQDKGRAVFISAVRGAAL